MSWTEKLKRKFIIFTGDGEKHEPLYKMNPKTTAFNVAEFEFPNIKGTLVKRSLVKGTRMNLEFYFQGENHLDLAERFEKSANDIRPFKILHPYFGIKTMQPTSLNYDPTGLGLTKITGEFIETIPDEYPRVAGDPKNKISFDFENWLDTSIESFGGNVLAEASDATAMQENNDTIYSLGSESIKSGDQANEYFQLYQTANSAVITLATDANNAARQVTNLYTYPSTFVSNVKDKLTLLLNQLLSISNDIENLLTFNEKTIYELSGGSIVAAMVNATINPIDGDYETSNEVLQSIDTVLLAWNTYIDLLSTLQTETNDTVDSYAPDFNSLDGLINLVNFGTSNLLQIALNASSERSIILEKDSNAIILAHRFYGLTEGDEELTRFINQNNLSANELLQIKKGKKIIYYV